MLYIWEIKYWEVWYIREVCYVFINIVYLERYDIFETYIWMREIWYVWNICYTRLNFYCVLVENNSFEYYLILFEISCGHLKLEVVIINGV